MKWKVKISHLGDFFFTLILNSDLFLEDVPHLAVGALSKINIVIVKKEYYKID